MIDIPSNYLDMLKRRSRPLKLTSERQECIQQFVDRINMERVGTRFKPVTWGQINGLVAHIKVADLYWLFKECERGDSFSKKFFGILKSTRVPKKK